MSAKTPVVHDIRATISTDEHLYMFKEHLTKIATKTAYINRGVVPHVFDAFKAEGNVLSQTELSCVLQSYNIVATMLTANIIPTAILLLLNKNLHCEIIYATPAATQRQTTTSPNTTAQQFS